MSRPFRFAVQSYRASSADDWRDQARRAEDLGYSAFHTADHHIGPGPALEATNHGVQEFAPIPAVLVAAEVTDSIKVGCKVFCTDYRNPVVFAKELATIDQFSDGRLEVGLGCGWLGGEYEAMGIEMDRPGTRIERMVETLTILRACFDEGLVDVDGRHVRATGFEGWPKPLQRPSPPVMIGGGSPRILGIAGREADIVSLNFDNRSGRIGVDSLISGQADATAEKVEWVRAGAGDLRFHEIELEIGIYMTAITDDPQGATAAFASRFGADHELLEDHPHALIGSVEAVCETLESRRERYGISYVTVPQSAAADFAPVVARLTGT